MPSEFGLGKGEFRFIPNLFGILCIFPGIQFFLIHWSPPAVVMRSPVERNLPVRIGIYPGETLHGTAFSQKLVLECHPAVTLKNRNESQRHSPYGSMLGKALRTDANSRAGIALCERIAIDTSAQAPARLCPDRAKLAEYGHLDDLQYFEEAREANTSAVAVAAMPARDLTSGQSSTRTASPSLRCIASLVPHCWSMKDIIGIMLLGQWPFR
jgi:hypothetical protein